MDLGTLARLVGRHLGFRARRTGRCRLRLLLGLVCLGRGRSLRLGSLRRRLGTGDLEVTDQVALGHGVAFLDGKLHHLALVGARDVHGRLVGFQRDQRVFLVDLITDGHGHLDDRHAVAAGEIRDTQFLALRLTGGRLTGGRLFFGSRRFRGGLFRLRRRRGGFFRRR